MACHSSRSRRLARAPSFSSSPRRAPTAILALAASVAGCADGGPGALEQSTITVDCRPGDVDCADTGLDRAVAIGASIVIDVAVLSAGSSTPPIVLRSTDDAVITAEGARLTATGEGFTALLFLAEGSGEVVDFVHVFTAAADALAVSARGDDDDDARPVEGPVQLLAGDALVLTAQPLRAGGPLGGEIEAAWSATGTPVDPGDDDDPPEVVTLLDTGFDGERRLVARVPGTAEIVVEALGLSSSIAVEVLP